MPRIEGSVEIAAPRQAVWNVISDPSRHTECTYVSEVRLVSEGEIGEGTVYREKSGPGFMKSVGEWTIITFDPPNQLVHTQKESSMTAAEGTWILEQIDSRSTRLTQTLEFEAMPRFRPLGRLLEALVGNRLAERGTARMLQDIKRIAETEASQEGPVARSPDD